MYLSNYKKIRGNKITILHFVEFLLCVCVYECARVCMCVHTYPYVHDSFRCPLWPVENIRAHGIGVADYCELPNVSAGNQPWVILDEKQALFTSELSL